MDGRNTHRLWGIFIILSIVLNFVQAESVAASPNRFTGPDRYTYSVVNYQIYQWWMMTWAQSKLVCNLAVEHEGLPSYSDVYAQCGESLANAWFEQENCSADIYSDTPENCPGYYMHFVAVETAQKEIPIALPDPVVWLTLSNCHVENSTNRCEAPPVLILHGDEPLVDQKITAIHGTIDKRPFSCAAPRCELLLSETDSKGSLLTFWADSSYGDSSHLFEANIRVVGVKNEQGMRFWYVDVLSSQWRGQANASCAEIWGAFPPEGGVPLWLSTPEHVDELASSNLQYTYLAGNLIQEGLVEASQCPNYGLDPYQHATPCGLQAAEDLMLEWQNRFDPFIMDAAKDSQVPAVLLKRLFARESQFWPGTFNAGTDVGFGQLTFEGADFAFAWNPVFFEQFCPQVLAESKCEKGYLYLEKEEQIYLRNALVFDVNAVCETCPVGIDLEQAENSVNIFAHTLRASCEQTASVIYNNTGKSPREVLSYEDLWRFTLVNYNAGAGCLGLAITATLKKEKAVNWENLTENLTAICAETKSYVNDITYQ